MAALAPAAAPASFVGGHYHFSVENVGRGSGAPVLAKAAYRSGECLFDARTGQFHDYTGGAERVMDTWVMARGDAPAWIQHAAREARQRAWNEAERADPNPKARIATELVVALPHELTNAQRKELLSSFVRKMVEKHGVFADVSVHTAHDERNVHAHILLSHRELGPDGFGEIANRHTITRKHRGQVKEMTTAGLATTPAEVKKLREQWAQDVNRAYEQAGLAVRVDHRSFKDRGLQKLATIHLGPTATKMERNGKPSDRGDINRIIEFGNAELHRLETVKQQLQAQIIDFEAKRAERQAQDATRGRRDEITPQDDSSRKRRKMAIEREDATDPKVQRKQIDDQQDLAAQAKEQTELSERFLASVKRAQEEGEKLKEAEQWAALKAAQDDDITDARSRYLRAAEHFDIRRPYASLSEIAGIEGATFQREQERLKREAAIERDPDKRELIDLRRQIEANDYMAITSERLSEMSKIITGNSNSEESQRQAGRAEYFAAEALELRRQREEVQQRIERAEQEREMQRVDQDIERSRRFLASRGGPRGDGLESSSSSSPPTGAAATEQDNRAEAEGWRSVGPEEVLQPGAHVRMDMQTGQSQVRGETAPETAREAEPWMKAQGGVAGLNDDQLESAGHSYDKWAKEKPEFAERHGFSSYVSYVQQQWARENAPETPREGVQAHEADAAASVQAQPATRTSEAERAAEMMQLGPTRPERAEEPSRENTDARQLESNIAQNLEVTDAKASKKAALAQARGEIEHSIEQGQDRGYEHSR